MRLESDRAFATATPTGWQVELRGDPAAGDASEALQDIARTVARHGGGRIEFWVEDATDADDVWVRSAGLEPYRDLLVLRVDLPIDAATVQTRAYADADADAFLEVNNRAFSWHPEQAGMTHADLAERQAEQWYDADGFRILERAGRIAGFCWTKVHVNEEPPLGEIYVIGVDPDFHGQGLGKPLTAAGLQWLANAGLEVGILYVESDNEPAVRTYEGLGFTRDRVNRAFEQTVEPT